MQVILASISPRRKELLGLLQIPFSVMEPDCDEDGQGVKPAKELVQHLARQKAQSVATRFPEALVLGGDTLIETDGEILGKPQNLNEAATMLRQLSGRIHQVHSGIALICLIRNRVVTAVETVQVHMKKLSETEVHAYLDTGESLGKAGGYCIQAEGAELITRIAGDYPTVVGLPLEKVAEFLEKEGVNLPIKIEEVYRRGAYPNWNRFKGE